MRLLKFYLTVIKLLCWQISLKNCLCFHRRNYWRDKHLIFFKPCNMRLTIILLLFLLSGSCSTQNKETPNNADTVISDHDFLRDFEPLTDTGLLNVVVEIPAGDHQKWEVNKESGFLEWEMAADTLREINYLPYPANYGMIPQTWLPFEDGGDDDPLDVILLGKAAERGSVIAARIVGVVKMLDGGEQDDKIIAIDPQSHFHRIYTLDDLQGLYPGIVEIITIWFESYKGEGHITIQSVEDEKEAMRIVESAISAYQHLYGK